MTYSFLEFLIILLLFLIALKKHCILSTITKENQSWMKKRNRGIRFNFFLTSMLDSRSFADVFQNRCSKHFSQHSELKRDSNTCFPVNIVKFLGIAVLQNFSHDCFCNFLNVIKQTISQRCERQQTFTEMSLLWHPNNFFFSTHRLMFKKSNRFLYKFVINCLIF